MKRETAIELLIDICEVAKGVYEKAEKALRSTSELPTSWYVDEFIDGFRKLLDDEEEVDG